MKFTLASSQKFRLAVALAIALCGVASQTARAQNAVSSLAPAPRVEPAVIGNDGRITITLPPEFASSERVRLGLFENGRMARVAEARWKFPLVNGLRQVALRVQADPGAYELRVLRDDKTRAPISGGAPILVPGVRREAGWWLLDGSPFFTDSVGSQTESILSAPLFITDLRREGKNTERNIYTMALAVWKTIPLPSIDYLSAPNFDWEKWRVSLQAQLSERAAKGERGFLGFTIAPHEANDQDNERNDGVNESTDKVPTPQVLASTFNRLRAALNAVAPGASLIFQNNLGSSDQSARELESYGATRYDAILLRGAASGNAAQNVWLVKVARRLAEEQKNFDLPIFLDSSEAIVDEQAARQAQALESAELDAWMSGVIGVINPAPRRWTHLVTRNLALFAGSVTLEDIGVLPGSATFSASTLTMDMPETSEFYGLLRQIFRVPLPARSGAKNESYLLTPGAPLDAATLRAARESARSGARVYLEGAPPEEPEAAQLWREITGAQFKVLEKPASTLMTLDDLWTFGLTRGSEATVQQSVIVDLKAAGTNAALPKNKDARKPEKGLDVLTEPRVVASLKDSSPAVVISPVGNGEVVWSPHRIFNPDREIPREYYAAMAAYIQPALVELHASKEGEAGAPEAPPVRVALRRSSRGTLMVALFNDAATKTSFTLQTLSGAGVVLDLESEDELSSKTRGATVQTAVSIGPRSWKILAFAATRRALDEERLAPLRRAKFR